jgi:hypothetical protein
MRNIVIAIGIKKNSIQGYGYISYRLVASELKPVTNEELSWGFKSDGPLKGLFWILSTDELKSLRSFKRSHFDFQISKSL